MRNLELLHCLPVEELEGTRTPSCFTVDCDTGIVYVATGSGITGFSPSNHEVHSKLFIYTALYMTEVLQDQMIELWKGHCIFYNCTPPPPPVEDLWYVLPPRKCRIWLTPEEIQQNSLLTPEENAFLAPYPLRKFDGPMGWIFYTGLQKHTLIYHNNFSYWFTAEHVLLLTESPAFKNLKVERQTWLTLSLKFKMYIPPTF